MANASPSEQLSAAESQYAECSDEAERRSKKYRGADIDCDPFPDIPPALLSSEHIKAYVRQTGMIYPFRDDRDSLKSASYEVKPGRQFIYWDADGKKIRISITKDGTFTLPPNSISFVQTELEFRLPQYIAVRFKLGLLMYRRTPSRHWATVDQHSTGDPADSGHNLTSDEYVIRGDEGLIWIEFTKDVAQSYACACYGCAKRDF